MNAKEEYYRNSEYGKQMQEHNQRFLKGLPGKKFTPDAPAHNCHEEAYCYGSDTVFDFYRCRICGAEWEILPW